MVETAGGSLGRLKPWKSPSHPAAPPADTAKPKPAFSSFFSYLTPWPLKASYKLLSMLPQYPWGRETHRKRTSRREMSEKILPTERTTDPTSLEQQKMEEAQKKGYPRQTCRLHTANSLSEG
jgi:hypothetical protein